MDRKLLFILPEGLGVSGITTYGLKLLLNKKGVELILLNQEDNKDTLLYNCHVHAINRAESHDPKKLEYTIRSIISGSQFWAIFPNSGDTAYLAVSQLFENFDSDLRKRIRVIAHVHGDYKNAYSYSTQHQHQISQFVGVSQYCRDKLVKMLPSHTDRIHYLPYPVVSKWPRIRYQKNNLLKLVFAGRLDEEDKKVSRLIPLCQMLHQARINFRLTIYGTGRSETLLKTELSEYITRNQVHFAGVVNPQSMEGYLRTHHILLLVSSREGTPLAIQEGMAAGLCPIVMQLDSDLSKMIDNESSGFIVEQGNVEGMADHIISLSQDFQKLYSLRARAQACAKVQWNLEDHLNRLDSIVDLAFKSPPLFAADQPLKTYNSQKIIIDQLLKPTRNSSGPFSIMGGGMFGRKVVDECLNRNISIDYIYDSDQRLEGFCYRNIPYQSPLKLIERIPDTLILGTIDFAEEMEQQVHALFEKSNRNTPYIISILP